jgi:hypothetical protein
MVEKIDVQDLLKEAQNYSQKLTKFSIKWEKVEYLITPEKGGARKEEIYLPIIDIEYKNT